MFDFNNDERTYILLKKGTGDHEGTIKVRCHKNCSTVYAELRLFIGNALTGERAVFTTGKAGGYGYDKANAAIADACEKAGILPEYETASDFEFKHSDLAERYCMDTCKVPVVSGTGNQKRAFELFFDVIEV